MRVRSGLKQAKKGGPVVLKSTTSSGMRQMRCTKCHTLMKPRQVGRKVVYACPSCGAEFQSVKM